MVPEVAVVATTMVPEVTVVAFKMGTDLAVGEAAEMDVEKGEVAVAVHDMALICFPCIYPRHGPTDRDTMMHLKLPWMAALTNREKANC